MSQVVRDRPFQIINRRDQSRFEPAVFLHLGGRDAFAPMTAASLGQVLKGQVFVFELVLLFVSVPFVSI
jgi:hypothetical protein